MNKQFLNKVLNYTGFSKFVSVQTAKNFSILMTGTFISAVIPIITAPLMSRIFTTTDYGILGIYMSINGLVGVLATAHYPQAIMLEKETEDAKQVVWFSIFFATVIGLVSLIILSILFFSKFLLNSDIGIWYFLIPVSVILNGIGNSLLIWANRLQLYSDIAANRVLQAIITVIIQIGLGLLIRNETGLILGLLAGQIITVVLILVVFYRKPITKIGSPNYQKFTGIAIKHKKLLIFSTPSEFMNNFINQMPIFLLKYFGGLSYVGSFNFAQRLLGVPQIFLSSAIVDVFKQKAAYAFNQFGNCKELFVKTTKALTIMAILPFGLLAIFSPSIFSFIFGKQWFFAGIFAQYLSILFFFRFIVSPLTYVYYLIGKLNEDLIMHLFFFGLTLISFYVGNYFFEVKKYLVLCYSIAYSLVYIIYFFRSYYFSQGRV